MDSQILKSLRLRGQVVQAVREFFLTRNFEELITPILWQSVPLEPTIYPFSTVWSGTTPTTTLFLPISPEKAMKTYLAMGFEECFTIGHCFRNLEGKSNTHHPEFLMLEWYRLRANYQQIIQDTLELIRFVNHKINQNHLLTYQEKTFSLENWPILSVEDLWQQEFNLSLAQLQTESAMSEFAKQLGYKTSAATWEQNFNQIFLNQIEPKLPLDPFILIDFPARLSPLCQPCHHRPWCAERFEVYIAGIEIGNGNTEQLDTAAVRQAFQQEFTERQRQTSSLQPVDEQFLESLTTLQNRHLSYAGMGLGVDRLTMIVGNLSSLSHLWPQL